MKHDFRFFFIFFEDVGYQLFSCDHFNKSFSRYLNTSDSLHSFLTFFLLLEEFPFSAHISSVTFSENVLFDCRDRLTGNDFISKSCLEWNREQMLWNQCF